MKGILSPDDDVGAAIQCLAHVPPLVAYVTSGVDDFQRKRINACRLAAEVFGIITEYWGSAPPPQTLDATEACAAFSKLHRAFSGRQHRGPHEALRLLVRGLHDALGKTPVVDGPAARHVARDAWEAHNAAEGYSVLTEIFQGQVEVRVAAVDGGPAEIRHEHFWDVTFPVDENSISGCLAKFLAPADCQAADGRRALATRRFVWLPLALVVNFKRFADKFVDYPVELELHDVSGAVNYTLVAVCVPGGTLTHVAGRWTHAKGIVTKPIDNLNSIIQRDASTLVYKRHI